MAEQRTPAGTGGGDGATHTHGLYAYALVPSTRSLSLGQVDGITDAAVDVVQRGDLGVVVSEVELTALDVDEDDLSETGSLATLARRHDEVVRSVFDQVTALPLRFGTVVRDRQGAVRLVDRCHEEASEVLVRLDGRREWGLRLRRTGDVLSSTEDDRAHDQESAASGTAYLARRGAVLKQHEAHRREERQLVDDVTSAMEPYAFESTRRRGAKASGDGAALLLDMAYLVDQGNEDAFLAEAERLATSAQLHGSEVEVTGPWPPYTFAHLDLSSVPTDA